MARRTTSPPPPAPGTPLQHRLHQRGMERVADPQPIVLYGPAPASSPRISSTAASSPPTPPPTPGPFTAAIPASASRPRQQRRHLVLRPAATATIAPPAGSACISAPRAATSAHPSLSPRPTTPAACAAATSPTE